MKHEEKIGVIYMYTSPSGKRYIGQTIREKQRKYDHKIKTSKYKTHFGQAIRKYGYENFEYKVLVKFNPCIDQEKLKRVLDKLEQRYIKLYKTNDPKFGYNLTKGGDGTIGYKFSEEECERRKQVILRKMEDPTYKDKILDTLSNGRNRSTSEETKQKTSNSRKNKKCVKQYDLELNLINTFSSIADAAKSINSNATLKTKSNRISECINGKQKTAYDFIWIKS